MTYAARNIVIAELAIGAGGGAMVVAALAANQSWLDRHFLPSFFLARQSYVLVEQMVRIAIGVIGALLALVVRRPFARALVRNSAAVLYASIAAAAALAAGEIVVRHLHIRATEWLSAEEEPRREADAALGWRIVPARAGRATIGGRDVDYAFDRAGYRVRRLGDQVDPRQPAILFTGESVMMGYGLTWEESVPAQVGSITGLQAANLAVNGFGTDQAYLRLRAELPRFSRPVAVVMVFMSTLFGRNLDDDRPHLGPGLAWQPAVPHARLLWLATFLVPYRTRETVERGILVTREVLRATATLARSRDATPLLLVPQLGPEDALERTLRRRIVDEAGVPYAYVEIDPAWRLGRDGHPDARAAHAMAVAIATRLRDTSDHRQ